MLTTHGAAIFLKVSKRSLERWRLSGLGPRYLKMGKCVRYRLTDLEAWIASRLIRSTSEGVNNNA
jgi:Helix-turn-helix domain